MENKKGFIYVIVNEYLPGLKKIGWTYDLKKRIKSLSKSTAIPGHYNLIYKFETKQVEKVETLTHSLLHEYRVDLSKEFFRVEKELAIRSIKKASKIITQNPEYLSEVFSNANTGWNKNIAKIAVEVYKNTRSITQVAKKVKKRPQDVDKFLNSIGLIETHPVYSNHYFPGFPKQCYKNGTFNKIVNEDTPLRTNKDGQKFMKPSTISWEEWDKELKSDLKRFRIKVSRKENIQAFKIFTNKTLEKFITDKPITKSEFLNIKEFNEYQYRNYGGQLCKIIRRYRAD